MSIKHPSTTWSPAGAEATDGRQSKKPYPGADGTRSGQVINLRRLRCEIGVKKGRSRRKRDPGLINTAGSGNVFVPSGAIVA